MTEPAFEPSGPCWACGGADLRLVHRGIFELSAYGDQDPALAAYTGAPLRLVRCAACGFAQPDALPALPGYFERMYDQRWSEDWPASEYASRAKDLIFDEVLDGLEARVRGERRRLLDVGAHVGKLLDEARRRGWETEGVETNARTSAYARETLGLRVHRGDVNTLALEGDRDAITLVDVLEHVPRPVELLRRLGELLKPGGWIAVKVPHGGSQLFKERLRGRLQRGYRPTVADNLVHVNHFSPRALRLALERAGFGELRVTVAPPELLEGRSAAAPNAARRLVWRVAGTVPGLLHTPLALHLLAFARRGA